MSEESQNGKTASRRSVLKTGALAAASAVGVTGLSSSTASASYPNELTIESKNGEEVYYQVWFTGDCGYVNGTKGSYDYTGSDYAKGKVTSGADDIGYSGHIQQIEAGAGIDITMTLPPASTPDRAYEFHGHNLGSDEQAACTVQQYTDGSMSAYGATLESNDYVNESVANLHVKGTGEDIISISGPITGFTTPTNQGQTHIRLY